MSTWYNVPKSRAVDSLNAGVIGALAGIKVSTDFGRKECMYVKDPEGIPLYL